MSLNLSGISTYQWCIGLLVSAVIGLTAIGYTETKEKLAEKASNESVQKIQKVIEVKQDLLLEARNEQKEINKELIKAIQDLSVQIVILNERQK